VVPAGTGIKYSSWWNHSLWEGEDDCSAAECRKFHCIQRLDNEVEGPAWPSIKEVSWRKCGSGQWKHVSVAGKTAIFVGGLRTTWYLQCGWDRALLQRALW
jgi:hypothetical protein